MTFDLLKEKINNAVADLLKLAEETTSNSYSGNFKFIHSEIKNSDENFELQRRIRIKENNRKTPVELDEIVPVILSLYDNIYDLNFYIHKAKDAVTIIDTRYYLRSSLEENYRKTVQQHEPMIHCKISIPPHTHDTGKKFDVNWEHYSL